MFCRRNCCCVCHEREMYYNEKERVLLRLGISDDMRRVFFKKMSKIPELHALFKMCEDYERERLCYL